MRDKLNLFLILLCYAAVTIATSYSDVQKQIPISKSYLVSSNCSNATFTSGTIMVSESSIVSPTSISFLSLGFPSSNVSNGQTSSGDIAPSLTRICIYSSSVVFGVTTSVYDCSDNSIAACSISLEHQN